MLQTVRWVNLSELQLLTHNHLLSVTLTRRALHPFTFSNGVIIPEGTSVAVPITAIHTDGEIYPNPEKFDGFRFANLREHDEVSGQQLVSTSADYLTFGYGRHAW